MLSLTEAISIPMAYNALEVTDSIVVFASSFAIQFTTMLRCSDIHYRVAFELHEILKKNFQHL